MLSDLILNVFFPPRCPVCQSRVEGADGVCPDCFARLRFISNLSADRASAVVYDQVSRQMILALKYGDRLDLAPLLARLMYNAGFFVLRDADILTGVPSHWKRMMIRKYNQAAVLAAELSKLSGIDVDPEILKRVRATAKQGSRAERFEHVQNAFVLNPKSNIRGKRIVLIDDVLTTGATTQACAGVLLKGGAKEVRILTFAKAAEND